MESILIVIGTWAVVEEPRQRPEPDQRRAAESVGGEELGQPPPSATRLVPLPLECRPTATALC